jgi:hypothetical protein
MSWLEDLSGELYARGVARRDRVRIVAELSDHIACDPGCEDRLGDPHTLAMSFADELATARARTSAFAAFTALAVAAVVLVISQITLGRFAHYPGYSNGISIALFIPALLGMVVAPQIALVAGSLAAWRAVRRRRVASIPADEIALIHRRVRVALAAGFATMAGIEFYVIDFSTRLPAWWLARSNARTRPERRLRRERPGRGHLRRPARARVELAALAAVAARRARVAGGRIRDGRVRSARRALGARGDPARWVRGCRRRDRIRRARSRDRSPAGAASGPRGRIDEPWDSRTRMTSPPTTN